MTIGEARRLAAARVGALDARYLVAWACGIGPSEVVGAVHNPMPDGSEARLMRAVARREDGWSVAHVTGEARFWGRSFAVTEHVLSPRPETESLVALALARPFGSVLDLGTGSGCIAVTLLAEMPGASGTATDLSLEALSCAEENAVRHGVRDRLDLRQGDWWETVSGSFELIVSNPPYIADHEMTALSAEVLREPHMALTPGGDGLAAYRVICGGLKAALSPGGRALLEIGPAQGRAVADLMRNGGLEDVTVHPDMDGRDRVVEGRRLA